MSPTAAQAVPVSTAIPPVAGRPAARLKPEKGEYRVLFSPSVTVRDAPWGRKIGTRQVGSLVQTDMRSIGGEGGGWVRIAGGLAGSGEAWMLINGSAIGLGTLLESTSRGAAARLVRYQVVHRPHVMVRDRPRGIVLGQRAHGRLLRADLELDGWVRLQEDTWRAGSAEPCEGWLLVNGDSVGLGQLLQPWSAPAETADEGGGGGAAAAALERYWVVAQGGTVVRERPWGRVLARRGRGQLLRTDLVRDGWARLQEDFVEAEADDDAGADGSGGGKGDAAGFPRSDLGASVSLADADAAGALLEGWVLIDGRDLGLPSQLARRADGEAEPPPPEPVPPAEARAARDAARCAAEAAAGEDWSIGALLGGAKGGAELAELLRASGVGDVHGLIGAVSGGDVHEELRRLGVAKLGQRQKLATLVMPYWRALALKEGANAAYRASRFEEAVELYTRALEHAACRSTDLALTIVGNRAACRQQMREPEAALRDVEHVLRFDPANAKARARRAVCESALQGQQAIVTADGAGHGAATAAESVSPGSVEQ